MVIKLIIIIVRHYINTYQHNSLYRLSLYDMKSWILHIRKSFTTQLALWVGGFVVAIFCIVILLLASFSQEVIRDESVETTLQALENTALRIDNSLRKAELIAHQQHQELEVDKTFIERTIGDNNRLTLPGRAELHVTAYDDKRFSSYIVTGEGGYREIEYGGEPSYIFFQPVYKNQYSLVMVCPSKNIYGQFTSKQIYLLVPAVIGLLVLLFVCWRVIGRHLRPLHLLADSAQRIADGHLNESIPKSSQKDEIGHLQNTLSKMQRSLASYMEEMQQKKDTLSRQNTQLQEAYNEAQEYDRLKANFIHQMTDQMVVPVETVCHHTDTIAANYNTLTKAEMAKIQVDILSATEALTQLLEQLLNAPAPRSASPKNYPLSS